MIVVAIEGSNSSMPSVILAAVTHSVPLSADDAIELPSRVKQALGLDNQRSWIVTDEINRVRWDDPGFVPVPSGEWSYGFLPDTLWKRVRDAIRSRATAGRLAAIARKS